MAKSCYCALLLLVSSLAAANDCPRLLGQAYQARDARHALVIGNANYNVRQAGVNLYGPLPNPVNDAQEMAKTLCGYGFKVHLHTDLNELAMEAALRDFVTELALAPNATALFYFSGHGAEWQDSNYLLPVNEDYHSGPWVQHKSLDAQLVLDELHNAKANLKIMILDACREHLPMSISKGAHDEGLRNNLHAHGSIIAYGAVQGGFSYDNPDSQHSLYTEELLHLLKTQPGLSLESLFKAAGTLTVTKAQELGEEQLPVYSPYLYGEDFCFGACALQTAAVDEDIKALAEGNAADIAALKKQLAAAQAGATSPPQRQIPGMVLIKGGCFQQGSPSGEPEATKR